MIAITIFILIGIGIVAAWHLHKPYSYPRWCFAAREPLSDYLEGAYQAVDVCLNDMPQCFYSVQACEKFRQQLINDIYDFDYDATEGGSERLRAHDFSTISHSAGCREIMPGKSIRAANGTTMIPSEMKWVSE